MSCIMSYDFQNQNEKTKFAISTEFLNREVTGNFYDKYIGTCLFFLNTLKGLKGNPSILKKTDYKGMQK